MNEENIAYLEELCKIRRGTWGYTKGVLGDVINLNWDKGIGQFQNFEKKKKNSLNDNCKE